MPQHGFASDPTQMALPPDICSLRTVFLSLAVNRYVRLPRRPEKSDPLTPELARDVVTISRSDASKPIYRAVLRFASNKLIPSVLRRVEKLAT